MDILRFLESDAIRNYWKETGFKPDPLQKAYLVFTCGRYDVTLQEKQDAYTEIMNTAGDYMISPRPWFPRECSLKDYLKDMLALQEKYITRFYSPEEDAYYVGKIHTSKYQGSEESTTFYFRTFDELKDSCSPLDADEHIVISRCVFRNDRKPITLSFNHDFEIAGTGILGESAEGEEGDTLFGLNAFFFDFPYPFKRFDLVYSTILGPENALLILEDPNKDGQTIESLLKEGDDTDMGVNCIMFEGDKCSYSCHPLLDLDYFDDSNYTLCKDQKIVRKLYESICK